MEVVGYTGVKATLANTYHGVPHDHWFEATGNDEGEWVCIRYVECAAYGYFEEVALDDLSIDPDWTAPKPPTVDPDFLSGYLRGDAARRQRLRDRYYRGTSQETPPAPPAGWENLARYLRVEWPPVGFAEFDESDVPEMGEDDEDPAY